MVTMRRAQLATAGLTFGLALAGAAPAVAAPNETVNASAFGGSVTLGGETVIEPTPLVTLGPDGEPVSDRAIDVPADPLLNAGAFESSAQGDPDAGTSTATGSAANVDVVPGATPLTPSLANATLISATCEATPDGATGSATLANLELEGDEFADATPPANTVVEVPGAARVVLNEQIENPDGSLTVNALHVTLADAALAEIIVGSATCGPNTVAPPINAIPAAGLPIAGGLVALFVVGGAVWLRRRPTTV